MLDLSFFENNKMNMCKSEFKLYDLKTPDTNKQ